MSCKALIIWSSSQSYDTRKHFCFWSIETFDRPNDSWWSVKDEDTLFKKIFIDWLCVSTFHSWWAFFIFSKVLNVESSSRDSERTQECSNPGMTEPRERPYTGTPNPGFPVFSRARCIPKHIIGHDSSISWMDSHMIRFQVFQRLFQVEHDTLIRLHTFDFRKNLPSHIYTRNTAKNPPKMLEKNKDRHDSPPSTSPNNPRHGSK